MRGSFVKITCFEDIRTYAKRLKIKPSVAVVEASDLNTVQAAADSAKDGIMHPVLIGDAKTIEKLAAQTGLEEFSIVPSESAEASMRHAVRLINTGEADALMKGYIESRDFLKAIVKKENNLIEEGKLLSLTGLFELPGYHKIIAVSDIVVNTHPDLNGKKIIIQNAVGMLNVLGKDNPKVAVLTGVGAVNPRMPETLDAAELKNAGIQNCIVEGPISFDLATSSEAAVIKTTKRRTELINKLEMLESVLNA
jgi:phosphotransacetylase